MSRNAKIAGIGVGTGLSHIVLNAFSKFGVDLSSVDYSQMLDAGGLSVSGIVAMLAMYLTKMRLK